jgi:Leucine-rich repeat (LRR) protein
MAEVYDCSNQRLRTFPRFIPTTITHINCSNNEIDEITSLPPKLVYLNISNNKIKSLPQLPETMKELICDNNLLQTLPNIPVGMRISCSGHNTYKLQALHNLKSAYYGGRDVTHTIRMLILQYGHSDFPPSNHIFGDPSPYSWKSLQIFGRGGMGRQVSEYSGYSIRLPHIYEVNRNGNNYSC